MKTGTAYTEVINFYLITLVMGKLIYIYIYICKRCGPFFSLFHLLDSTVQVALYISDRTYSLTTRV